MTKFYKSLALVASSMAIALSANAEILEINETNFPDSQVRAFLTSQYCTTSTLSNANPGATDLTSNTVDTEKIRSVYYLITVGSYYSNVQNLECLKLFPNLKGTLDLSGIRSSTSSVRGVSIDVSGTQITSITNGWTASTGGTQHDLRISRIIADNCKELKTITVARCKNLVEFSLKGSDNLTSVTLPNCPALEYLDLSACADLTSVEIFNQTSNGFSLGKLKALKLGDYHPKLYNLKVEYCDLEEINLKGLSNEAVSATGKSGLIDVNGNPKLKYIDVRHLPNIHRILWSGNAFTYLNFLDFTRIPSASINRTTTHSRHVGYLPDGRFDVTDGLFDNLATYSRPANVKGGKFEGKYFVFNDGVTTGSYKMPISMANGSNNYTNTYLTVTLYRELTPREFYLVGDQTDWQFNEIYKLTPSEVDNNKWELNGVTLYGDFEIWEKGGQELRFGAHKVEHTRPFESTKDENDWNSSQTTRAAVAAADTDDEEVATPAKPFMRVDSKGGRYLAHADLNSTDTPGVFTTHNYHSGYKSQLKNVLVTFDYTPANDAHVKSKTRDELGVLTLSGGNVTGVDEVIADNTADDLSNLHAPAEYFNLQGVRVSADNLTPGIYIRRQGTVTTKVAIR